MYLIPNLFAMKRIVVVCFIFMLLISCSLDDDATGYSFEVLPVESVNIPNEFQLGEIYPITVSYFRPSTCHAFKEFYYLKENNEQTVAPITFVIDRNDCEIIEDELVEASFNFKVTSYGSYIFKFWQGDDTNGEAQYLTIEVPVID
jgi:hypothetical protein